MVSCVPYSESDRQICAIFGLIYFFGGDQVLIMSSQSERSSDPAARRAKQIRAVPASNNHKEE